MSRVIIGLAMTSVLGMQRIPERASTTPTVRYDARPSNASWENDVRFSTESEPPAVTTARIALLALRVSAVQQGAAPLNRYFVGPGSAESTTHEAALRLADLPKPITCVATVVETGLSIVCAPIGPGAPAREHEIDIEAFERPSTGFLALMQRVQNAGGDGVLILGTDGVVLAPLSAFRRWYRDYQLPDRVSVGVRAPTADERFGGAAYVVLLSMTDQL